MRLPFFTRPSPAGQVREYTLTLEIGSGFVRSAVWSVVNGRITVLAVGPYVRWDNVSAPALVTASDNTVSGCLSRLDPSGRTQPDKVIFGVPADWVQADRIHPDRLRLLKPLTRDLGLKAVGFCLTPQAIVRHLQQQESVPPTAILIGIYPEVMEVTLVRLGKIHPTEVVRRSGKTGVDLAEGLTRFRSENMLPSRMLVYGPVPGLEQVRQEILSFAWQAPQHRLPFLHFPKVEILPDDIVIQAVSQAAGGEALVSAPADQPPAAPPPADSAAASASAADLGFYPDVDIAVQPPADPAPPPPLPSPAASAPAPVRLPQVSAGRHLPGLIFRRRQIVILLLLIFPAALLAWFIWFHQTAEITLAFTPKTHDLDLVLTADSGLESPDLSAGRLPAVSVTAEVSDTQSKPATGSKIVGDKAVGRVSLVNGTSVVRSFTAGTVLTSPSGLIFTTDTAIEVASASGTADPNSYQPGKAEVAVTASIIGSDSNLSAGTQFTVASFSPLDFVAKNDTAFTGGSSRQVRAVTREDLADLKSEMTASLSAAALEQLAASVTSDRLLIPESAVDTVVSETASHQPDAIADTVSLTLVVRASGLSLAVTDLDNLVSGQAAALIPADWYQYRPLDYSFSPVRATSSQAEFSVRATAHLLPRLDYDRIKHDIRGLSLTAAQNYLQSLPAVASVKISFFPAVISWYKFIPHVTQNIRFTIQPS